ncbi:alpha/beta hydrolase family protein [Lysobacter sp. TAB13]|uniref:alpha/beta hydrolase family protein n=1 Tax=Lysobacter sp. TAB13 TaxID=3233065 RepID=UPI003F9ACB6F
MKTNYGWLLMFALIVGGCSRSGADASAPGAASNADAEAKTLTQARASVDPQLIRQQRDGTPVPVPPPGTLDLVRYPAAAGELAAYLSPRPAQPGKHPAIIWISGGDSNTIGDSWTPQSRDNDQSAMAFRQAGVVTMYPSLRGGNDNPGVREAFYGEVQDILAAADYLAKLDFVDPKRIYLGGHSTGGTLVLLVAETDPRFRGVFAFGPVADVSGYGEGMLPVALDNEAAIRLRSPVHWTASIRSPVFVFEGDHDANTEDLLLLRKLNQSPQAKYFLIPRATHFSTLAPANELIAKKIIADRGERSDIGFSEAELSQLLP